MRNSEWIELIEEKREQIEKEARKTYKEARENTNLRFVVEMDSDGDICSWYEVAGGNSYHVSRVPDCEILQLMDFCFQFSDPTAEEEEPLFIEMMTELGRSEELEKLYEKANEECETFMGIVVSSGEYTEELRKCDEQIIEFYCEEYAPAEIEDKINELLSYLDLAL